MHHDKVYTGKMHLHSDISEEKLKQEMEKFNGKIMQKPPVKSAVKRVLREREIYYLEVLEINGHHQFFATTVLKPKTFHHPHHLVFFSPRQSNGEQDLVLRQIPGQDERPP